MRTTSKMAILRPMKRAVLLLLVLGVGRAGRGEVLTPAERGLVKVERKLDAARGRVTVTAEQVYTSQSLRLARLGVLNACRAAHDAAEKVRKQAAIAETIARDEAIEAEQVALEAAQALERSRRSMQPARDRFLNRPLMAYDLVQRGNLTFNTLTGAFDLSLDRSPGVTLSTNDLDALLAGRFKLPDVDPLQLATDSVGLHSRLDSNYGAVAAGLATEHGLGNSYLLSRRFLEWATTDRLAGDFAQASLKSGGSVSTELAMAQRQIQFEYEDLAAWLRLKGIKDLGPDPASILVELIRTGSYPRLGLSIKTTQVEYTSRPEPLGGTDVPVDYLKRLRPKGLPGHAAGKEMKEKRPALVVIWNGPTRVQGTMTSPLDSDFRLSPPAIGNLPKLLPTATDPRIRRLLGETAAHGLLEIDAQAKSRQLARAAIGLRKEDIAPSDGSSGGIVDLRRSDFSEVIASFLTQLALGNQKTCNVEVLEFDRSNGRLEAVFTLRHRHSWASLREAQVQLRRALGPTGTDVEDLADHLPDTAFDAARKLFHEADKYAHETGKLAYEAEQRAHEASDCIATKSQEVAALAAELIRAQADLRTASDREGVARREAQSACVQMLELDHQVRLARNRARGPEPRQNAEKTAARAGLRDCKRR